jgi:hypothetical protein
MTVKINADTSDGLKLASDTSGEIDLQTNGTTKVHMDSSGNVGIGTSSPNTNLEIKADSNLTTDFPLRITNNAGSGYTDFGVYAIDTSAVDLVLKAGGNTSITIDKDNGNVGIGTSSPQSELHISGASTPEIRLTDTTNTVEANFFTNDTVGTIGSKSNHAFVFNTNNTERMRIDTDGFVGIGVTTTQAHLHVDSEDVGSIFGRACIAATTADPTGDSLNQLYVAAFTGDSNVTNATFLSMRDSDGEIGNITANGASSVAYNTSSDYRLKENVDYAFDATTRLKQLKPCRFNFIADPDTTKDGFLAHEVSSIVPEAVTGTHDETRECVNVVKKADGKMIHENVSEEDWTQGKIDGTYADDTTWSATATVPRYQGIDQSKLVPLLVKTIQELEARITALENN